MCRLVLAARSEEKLKETQRLCLQYSPHVEVVVADVSQEHKCKEIVDRAVHSIDMLILNAASSPPPGWFTDMEEPVSSSSGNSQSSVCIISLNRNSLGPDP